MKYKQKEWHPTKPFCVCTLGWTLNFPVFLYTISLKNLWRYLKCYGLFSSLFPRLAKSATFSPLCSSPEAEFLNKILTKVLRVFLVATHSRLYSFALRFLFLHTHAVSYSFYSSVTVTYKYTIKEKGEKPDRKP
jgi:hypothetical protein